MRCGAILLGCALAGACSDDGGDGSLIDGLFTAAEWDQIGTHTPLGDPPPSPTNRYADDPAVAALGQRLWFEKRYAGPITVAGTPENGGLGGLGERGKVACASCHDPEHWFQDVRSIPNRTSLGTAVTRRNAPSMVNAVFYEWGNWAGAHDQFWKQGANGPESRDNFNSDRLTFVHVVFDHYRAHYDALFPTPLDPALDPTSPDAVRFPPRGRPKSAPSDPDGPWERMTAADRHIVNTIVANCGKALEAYERQLISRDAPFDRYVAGASDALTQSAKRGLKLFIGKAACDECHQDATFTNQRFHNTGVPQDTLPYDDGRLFDLPRALINTWSGAGSYSDDPAAGMAKLAGHVASEDLRGAFRTKSLRHVAMTAPYFHDGSMATLLDVVRFYNEGGGRSGFPGTKDPRLVPLNLSDQEMLDLVAFLESLTGEPVPAALRVDTAAR